MPRKKKLYYPVGKTVDDKFVMAGVYKFYETQGLPLDTILTCFQQKGWIPDWTDFYKSALAAGMEHTRILGKLEEAISDSFGKEWADQVISRLDALFKNKEPQ